MLIGYVMHYRNLNYSFYVGFLVSLIGLTGLINRWMETPALHGYISAGEMQIALSTSISLIFLGVGLMFSLGVPESELEFGKVNYRTKLISLLLIVPASIAFYNFMHYLALADFQFFKPFIQDSFRIPMAFLTSIQLILASMGLLVFSYNRTAGWAASSLGLIGTFLFESALFATIGYWTNIPVLFSFLQAIPTLTALILVGTAFLQRTIYYKGLLSPLVSSSGRIRALALLGLITALLILAAGVLVINSFQVLAQNTNQAVGASTFASFEFSTIAISMLVMFLSLRVVFFYESGLNAEKALHDSLDELTNLKQAINSSSIVVVTDSNGNITNVNDAFCAISKYTKEELIGQPHRIVNSGYHAAEFFQDLWQTIQAGRIWKGEIQNRAKDGTLYWVSTTIYPFLDERKVPVCYIAIHYDITPLKTAQDELRANAYRQEIISMLGLNALSGMEIEKLLERVAVQTVRGLNLPLCKILELLPSGKEFLLTAGYGWDEGLVGKARIPAGSDSQAGFTLLMDEPVIVEDFNKEERLKEPVLLKTHKVVSGMSVIIHGETPEKPYGVLSVHATEPRHFEKEDIAFLQSVANVLAMAIERKHAEKLLREFSEELEDRVAERTRQLEGAKQEAENANQLKTKILAFVSHDFKNPLAAMERFIHILGQHDKNLTKDQHEIISYISDGIRQLRAMVTDILDKARMEEGKLTLSLEWIEIRPFIDELKPVFDSLPTEKDIKLAYDIQPELLGFEADRRFLRQIILNLMSNAIKYNKPGGAVLLKIQESSNHQFVLVEVQDTGIGIAPDKIPQLFKEFFRAGTTSYQTVEGTGLGLAFIKKLIDMHGGQITVMSELDRGSTFTVMLPHHITSVLPAKVEPAAFDASHPR